MDATLDELVIVVEAHPPLRNTHYSAQLKAVVGEWRHGDSWAGVPGIWTHNTAQRYGRLLRRMSVVHSLLQGLSSRVLVGGGRESGDNTAVDQDSLLLGESD